MRTPNFNDEKICALPVDGGSQKNLRARNGIWLKIILFHAAAPPVGCWPSYSAHRMRVVPIRHIVANSSGRARYASRRTGDFASSWTGIFT